MTGSLTGSSALELAVYDSSGTFNLTGDASGFTGSLTTASSITTNLAAGTYNFSSLTPNGTLNLASGTRVNVTGVASGSSLLAILRNTVGNATVISKIGGDIELLMGGVSPTIRANHTISGPGSRQAVRLNSNTGGATTTTVDGGRTLALDKGALLRLESHSTLKVCGALTIDNDTLQLGHWSVGAYEGKLLIEGGDVSIKNFELLGGSANSSAHSSVVMNSGTLKLTGAGNAFSNVGEAASRTTYVDVALNGGVIKTEGNSWTLNRNATIGGIEVQTGTGRITLGNSDTTMLLRGTITNEGNLGLAGTATVDLTDKTAFKLYNGRGSANEYSGTGNYSGSGFLIGDTAQYYLVKGGENRSLTGAFSTLNGADVVENAETGSVVISAAAELW
ncbi:MAG: hypothetical protein Q4Q25_03600 [Methanocorpusculum sp.]|nr:hypothetical protein [Methanocorpusculum sp.]